MFKEGAVKGALLLFKKRPTPAFSLILYNFNLSSSYVGQEKLFNFNIKQLQPKRIFSPSPRFAQNLNYPILFIMIIRNVS